MKPTHLVPALLLLGSLACQAPAGPQVVAADAAVREGLFGAVTKLEGRWAGANPDGTTKYTEFAVTSGGSVVRELMLPGEEHEMLNLYALDGNSLVMTHYCAGGNQPRMRATKFEDGRLVFHPESVADLTSKDQVYMGAMTLTFTDDDNVEQRWSALKAGEFDSEMVIQLKRVK